MPDEIRIAELAAPHMTDLELAIMAIKSPLAMFVRMAYVTELANRIIQRDREQHITKRDTNAH